MPASFTGKAVPLRESRGKSRNHLLLQDSKASHRNAKAVALEVKVPNSALEVAVYPNPTSGQLNLPFYTQLNKKFDIRITNTAGRLVQSQSFEIKEINEKASLGLSSLPAGVYFILTRNGQDLTTENVNKK